MFPLPLSKLDVLDDLFAEAIKEFNSSERTSVEFLKKRMAAGYAQRSIDGYVDNVDKPKHVLVLEKSHGGATEESLLEVRFIFSTASERSNPEAQAAFKKQIENYAEIFGCDAILASSWCYRGTRRIDAFWVGQGFERQEIIYVKLRKKD